VESGRGGRGLQREERSTTFFLGKRGEALRERARI